MQKAKPDSVFELLAKPVQKALAELGFSEPTLPQVMAKLHQKFSTPYYSIWAVGILMALLVLFFDLTGVVAISTFGALFYYAVTNAAALKLKTEKRRYHRLFPAVGLATCIVLLAFIRFAAT
jgi:amino acid transporter